MAHVKIPTRVLNKGLQLAENLVYHFFVDEKFMNRCLKFKHKTETVMAQYKKVYTRTRQCQVTSSLTKSSVSPSAMHSASFDHSGNIQLGTLTTFQWTQTHLFLCLLIINLHVIIYRVFMVHLTPS